MSTWTYFNWDSFWYIVWTCLSYYLGFGASDIIFEVVISIVVIVSCLHGTSWNSGQSFAKTVWIYHWDMSECLQECKQVVTKVVSSLNSDRKFYKWGWSGGPKM